MNRFVSVWEESTGFAWLTDGLIQNTVQCGGSGSEPESRTVLCVEKRTMILTEHRVVFFWEENKCVDASHFEEDPLQRIMSWAPSVV